MISTFSVSLAIVIGTYLIPIFYKSRPRTIVCSACHLLKIGLYGSLTDHLKIQLQVAFFQLFNNSHLKIQVQLFNNIQIPYLERPGPRNENCGWGRWNS